MPDTDSGRFRIVLIEDSPLLCAMLREMLDELEGVEVVADAMLQAQHVFAELQDFGGAGDAAVLV